MSKMRLVNALAAFFSGLAVAIGLVGELRIAIAALGAATILQLWSLEMLRSLTIHRETRR